ncbi:MAG: DUF1801 domain-containing protein [Thaumarchaeota archaeon]|nr:DUF1801 domain-containing protein [Nitrososphaerota archaeon]
MATPVPQIIDKKIAALGDWRGETMATLRKVIHEADPEIVEELKWLGTPVFTHDGNVVLFEAFKDKVKLTFPEGASLPDPHKLFNAGLGGGKWRAIDFFEGGKVNKRALKALVKAAVAQRASKKKA